MSSENVGASDGFNLQVNPAKAPYEANVLLEVIRDGKVIETRTKHNLVVNIGKGDMASRLVVTPTKLYKYMRLGHNNAAPNSAQTTITTIVTGSNRTCNTAAMSGARTAKFIRTWQTTDFSATGIKEAGLFSQLTNAVGTMMARVTFTAVNKTSHDTLKITWTIKVN